MAAPAAPTIEQIRTADSAAQEPGYSCAWFLLERLSRSTAIMDPRRGAYGKAKGSASQGWPAAPASWAAGTPGARAKNLGSNRGAAAWFASSWGLPTGILGSTTRRPMTILRFARRRSNGPMPPHAAAACRRCAGGHHDHAIDPSARHHEDSCPTQRTSPGPALPCHERPQIPARGLRSRRHGDLKRRTSPAPSRRSRSASRSSIGSRRCCTRRIARRCC